MQVLAMCAARAAYAAMENPEFRAKFDAWQAERAAKKRSEEKP